MSKTYVWSIKDIKGFSGDVFRTSVYSESFFFDSRKVHFAAEKKENDCLRLCVYLDDCSKLTSDVSIGLSFSITLLNKDSRRNISRCADDEHPRFFSSTSTNWGWIEFATSERIVNEAEGFLQNDGSIDVEIILFPIRYVKWGVGNFRSLTERTDSPIFEVAGFRWKILFYPKGTAYASDGFASAFLCSVSIDECDGLQLGRVILYRSCTSAREIECTSKKIPTYFLNIMKIGVGMNGFRWTGWLNYKMINSQLLLVLPRSPILGQLAVRYRELLGT